MIKIGDYEKIVSDHLIFNQIVYTPLSEALRLLEERRKDVELVDKVKKILNNDIPPVLENNRCGIFARQLATPNFDTQRFIKITKENNLETVLFEYPEDKFTSKNVFKHSLGQIRVHNKINKKGEDVVEKINIIDLVKHDGKKIKELQTVWGEPLIDFHRKLFTHYNLSSEITFYDISGWYGRNGGSAVSYYKNFLMLFVAHGILFENFLTNDKEKDFSENVVLPAIEEVFNITGCKPLIVPLSTMDDEEEDYWISHPMIIKNIIPK